MNAEETKQKIAELEALRSQIRRWRVGAAIVVIAIVIVCVCVVVSAIRNLVHEGPQQQVFVTELTAGLSDHVVPPAKEIATQTFNELSPLVQDEFKKLNERTPELVSALTKESELLLEHSPERAGKIMDKVFADAVKRREAKIKKLLPDLTDENLGILVHNLIEHGGIHVTSLMDEVFKPQEDTLSRIVENLYKIQELEAENTKNEAPTWDMAVLLFDLIQEDLGETASPEYVEALKEGVSSMVK